MIISIHHFLSLRFKHEHHDYHKEGSLCIYQDLIKNKYTIRQILFAISENQEYLNPDKYSENDLLYFDHMTHYLHCILYGFRKEIPAWREKGHVKQNLIKKDYYLSKSAMNEDEIRISLSEENIKINNGNYITDGFHRCFCMMGRLLRNEPYIPFLVEGSLPFILQSKILRRSKTKIIKNVGYRKSHNRNRLKKISKHIDQDAFTMIDIGSNYGFFSMSVASSYPCSQVFSVEGSYGTGNDGLYNIVDKKISSSSGIKSHRSLKKKMSVFNNHILCALMTDQNLRRFVDDGIVFDYQVSLSVFHWIVFAKYGNNGSPEDIDNMLAQHLSCAKTTFIELPDVNQITSMSPAYQSHNSVEEYFREMIKRCGLCMQVEFLGKYNWYGRRDLFKVTRPNFEVECKVELNDVVDILRPVEVF